MSVKSALESIKPDEKLIYDTEKLLRSRIGKKKFGFSKLVAAACLPIVLGVLSLSLYIYNLPVSYVSFDVNPSLELGINRFDRVVNVNYYNNDAKSLMSKKEVYLRKPAEAIDAIMAELDKKGYLSISKATTIAIAVNCEAPSDSNKLLDECTKDLNKYPERINVIGYTVTGQFREEADALSISFGKLKLIKLIQQLDKSATVKDFKGHSITSITDYLSYLTSDEYTGADENIKNSVKTYIDSIKAKVDTDSKTNTGMDIQRTDTAKEKAVADSSETAVETEVKTETAIETDMGNVTTEAAAVQAAAEAVKEKATTEAAAVQAAAETVKEKATTEAAVVQAAAEAEREKATTDAAVIQAAAEAEKEKATTDAVVIQAAAEAEKEKATAEAAAAQAAAEAEKAQAITDAAAAQAAAEAEKAQATTDAAAAQAAAEAEKARAEIEAAEANK